MEENREELLKEIERLRGSTVLCYIGGDKQNISTRIAPDIIPVFHKHLRKIKNCDKLDLFLFTKGGDVLTALRLVQLIYEYTNNFSVLIPYKSYSAGTLISLGASEIVMGKMGELSPVDPNVTSMFNPEDGNNHNAKLPISVEDVYSFFKLATNVVGIKNDDSLMKIFTTLTSYVNPLAIGSVYRTHSLIRSIATKLLQMHMKFSDSFIINEIVDHLTEKLHSHSYMITRKEAKEIIKLPVTYCDEVLDTKLWTLYEMYERELKLEKPFFPEKSADSMGNFSVTSGIIESKFRRDDYVFQGNIGDTVTINEQGWKKFEEM